MSAPAVPPGLQLPPTRRTQSAFRGERHGGGSGAGRRAGGGEGGAAEGCGAPGGGRPDRGSEGPARPFVAVVRPRGVAPRTRGRRRSAGRRPVLLPWTRSPPASWELGWRGLERGRRFSVLPSGNRRKSPRSPVLSSDLEPSAPPLSFLKAWENDVPQCFTFRPWRM